MYEISPKLEGAVTFPSRHPQSDSTQAFPSPDEEREVLVNRDGPVPLCDPSGESTASSPFPAPTAPVDIYPQTPTPSQDDCIGLGFLGIPGDIFPHADLETNTPPSVKAGYNLRLPSFQTLGIAAPHPDHFTSDSNTIDLFSGIGAGPPSKPEDPLHAASPLLGRPGLCRLGGESPQMSPTGKPNPQFIPNFTPPADSPPEEVCIINWGSFGGVKTAAMGTESASPEPQLTTPALSEPAPYQPSATEVASPVRDNTWLDGAVNALEPKMQQAIEGPSNSIKVLSHALPCPSTAGHAFPYIISTIHNRIPPTPTHWINVFHAVPGSFNLADLPSSPPNTPGPAIGGDDYFTAKIFDSAVPIADYQGESTLLASSPPRPVVAPCTVDVSVVERYIPPTNINEFKDMFTMTPASLLMGRLIELSLEGGTMIFIYPTKLGGQTFMKEYLGPLIDPVIRSAIVVNHLSRRLATSLGEMAAVSHLLEYEAAHRKVQELCERLNQDGSALAQFSATPAKFHLIHSSKQAIFLDRKVWLPDWWIKQEKPRIRGIVTQHYTDAARLGPDAPVASQMIEAIMKDLLDRPYSEPGPTKGVEVAVFVIRKTS